MSRWLAYRVPRTGCPQSYRGAGSASRKVRNPPNAATLSRSDKMAREQLRIFNDKQPDFEVLIDRLATWLA